jgi:hypothetical protein
MLTYADACADVCSQPSDAATLFNYGGLLESVALSPLPHTPLPHTSNASETLSSGGGRRPLETAGGDARLHIREALRLYARAAAGRYSGALNLWR